MPSNSGKSKFSFGSLGILLLGILSISTSWIYGFTGLIIGIFALRFAKSAKSGSTLVIYGKIFAIVGIIISSIFAILILFRWILPLIGK